MNEREKNEKKTRILCRYEKSLRLQAKITTDVARVTGAGQNYWQIM